MRVLILMACLIAAVVARPEVGYTYNGLQQHNQLGLPQNVHSLPPLVHQQLPAEHSFATFGSSHMTYNAPLANNMGEQLAAPIVPEEPSALPTTSVTPQEDSYRMAYQQSLMPHESGYPYAPPPTQVHKHIYVHVPPKEFEDEDAIQPHVRHQVAPKQKHYKIVFIKAPSAPSVRPPIVAPPPQNEEKTLIYVLHKKPDTNQEIVIPTVPPTKPSKPEVYFIKYKTKKEEAPVYGPPPANAIDPRNPSGEYGPPAAEDFMQMDDAPLPAAPLTTMQPPAVDEQLSQQIMNDIAPPSELYGVPTMISLAAGPEMQPTVAAPNSQYLAPDPTQIAPAMADEARIPASNYGPPNRFFIKKK